MSGDEKKTTSNTTQTQAIDPRYQQLQLDNFDTAKTAASGLNTPYTGQLTAGFGNYLDAPTQGYTDLSHFQAPTINRGDIRTINAGQLKDTNLDPYLNPFTKNVIDATTGQLSRQYGVDSTAANAQATAAHAFGGSRSGILGGQIYDAYNRNLSQTVAGLNQNNFTNAQGAALTDIGNRLDADKTNAGYDFNVAANNQNAGLQSAGVRSGALGALTGLGQLRQGADQDALSAAYNEFQRQQQGALAGQQLLNSTLGTLQAPTTSTGFQDQTQTTTPGLGSILGSALQLGSLAAAPFTGGASGGLGGMFGGLFGGSRAALPGLGSSTLFNSQALNPSAILTGFGGR